MKKRISSIILAIALTVAFIPAASVTADEGFIITNGVLTGYTGSGGAVVIPGNITQIGYRAFYNKQNITSVTIPNSVITIGHSAFQGCMNLSSVTFGSGVVRIDEAAFYGCTGLTNIVIPNNVMTINKSAFYGCTSLASVMLGSGLTAIGDNAFYGCTSLASIIIPNSVTTIGSYAFGSCISLSDVTFGSGLTAIGANAFSGCISLTSIVIPNSVTSIGQNAFSGCISLTSAVIPNSVTNMGFLNTTNNNPSSVFGSIAQRNGNLVIYGTAGTLAERYANRNNITFSTGQPPVPTSPAAEPEPIIPPRLPPPEIAEPAPAVPHPAAGSDIPGTAAAPENITLPINLLELIINEQMAAAAVQSAAEGLTPEQLASPDGADLLTLFAETAAAHAAQTAFSGGAVTINQTNTQSLQTQASSAVSAVEDALTEAGVETVRDMNTDISNKSAAVQEAVNVLASKGIITGTSSTAFSPDSPITRAEIAALVVRTLSRLDENADGGFSDVARNDWYFGAVGSAKNYGIIQGVSETRFEPRGQILKEQLTAIAARTLRSEMKWRTPGDVERHLRMFTDRAALPAWGTADFALAAMADLIVLRTDGRFSPSDTMTRGDAAVVLYRMFMRIW